MRLERNDHWERSVGCHGFSGIRTVQDYRRRVPISTYADYRGYVQRVRQGEIGAMFGRGTQVLMMSMTSGTTGEPKYIPITNHFFREYRSGWNIWGLDGYTRTKAEAEVLLKRHMEEYDLPAVILRPGFIYGPGDRHVVPRLIERLAAGKMKLIGSGERLLNNTYVGNLVDAILLAMTKEEAIGETFNIRDERLVTRNEFVYTIADYMKCARPRHVPEWVARRAVGPIEWSARIRGSRQAPLLTRGRIKFLAQNLDFSIAKAISTLGYRPSTDFKEGMGKTLRWADNAGLIPDRG